MITGIINRFISRLLVGDGGEFKEKNICGCSQKWKLPGWLCFEMASATYFETTCYGVICCFSCAKWALRMVVSSVLWAIRLALRMRPCLWSFDSSSSVVSFILTFLFERFFIPLVFSVCKFQFSIQYFLHLRNASLFTKEISAASFIIQFRPVQFSFHRITFGLLHSSAQNFFYGIHSGWASNSSRSNSMDLAKRNKKQSNSSQPDGETYYGSRAFAVQIKM